ncbi:phage major capsid protein [Glutamicibacter uratoxydans]|uniref:phage major capsid protein n=1 Tax=Glutamicibacter uratoxydans TaxID=43667 RepID=UPI003D6F7F06
MALSTSTAPELTAEQVQKILVQPLAEKSIFLAAGPRIFDTNGSPVRVPKMGGETDPAWHGQNELITEVEADFDEVLLLPDTIKSIKTITRYSNELARQSIVSLDAALRDRLVTDVAAKFDTTFLGIGGDGVTTPQGMFGWADTQEIEHDAALDLDVLLDAWGLALAANVNIGSLQWFLRPEQFTGLRKVKDTAGQYLLQPDPTADGVFRLWGSKVNITSRVPAGNLALADMSQIAVARDMNPTVKVLTERYADYDQQALRVVARYDAQPLNAEAVIKVTGIV